MSSARIAVLGLGNLMRADDALGMLAIQRLRRDSRLPPSVLLIEGGTLGLDLLHPLQGITHLLAIDAIESGVPPGTLLRFAGSDVDLLPIGKSVHLLGFSDLIGALRLTGSAPQEIVVLGIQPLVIGWSTELTSSVAAALPELLDAALEQIAAWTAGAPSPSNQPAQLASIAEPK
ncbi:MAG TPA: HyaD/HybD family hydrogenase maturation endopeptidase [Terracidiphilus sp.]|nr:HyaD/HybD family hydrogenase maturation endopeptidase [Terracidiphilus sp.]